ncbi:MAG: hypothetical protein LJE83_11315 [Gammaproteobacteria bacterium]|nr:hypothetical protein [Gammaproteobacteria bacterium]
MQFDQHPVIKYFIKNNLGCTCPENVFDEIDVEQKNQLAGKQLNFDRILVGNRLLIYVLKDIDMSNLHKLLPLVVRTGKEERNAMKFNRFRLVLKRDNDIDMESLAYSIFENIPEKDEKIHLHFIADNEANALSGIFKQQPDSRHREP